MVTVEVTGKFVFRDGVVEFVFGDDKTMQFHMIKTMEDLRAALVGIATFGTQASVDSILQPKRQPKAASEPASAMEALLAKSERTFQKFQEESERVLKQAEREYRTATGNALPETG